jgi:hypothetical protein
LKATATGLASPPSRTERPLMAAPDGRLEVPLRVDSGEPRPATAVVGPVSPPRSAVGVHFAFTVPAKSGHMRRTALRYSTEVPGLHCSHLKLIAESLSLSWIHRHVGHMETRHE